MKKIIAFLILTLVSTLAYGESNCPKLSGRWECFMLLGKTTYINQTTNSDNSEVYEFITSPVEGARNHLFTAVTNNTAIDCDMGRCISRCENIDGKKVLHFYGESDQMKGLSQQRIITPTRYSTENGKVTFFTVKLIEKTLYETKVYEGDCRR